MRKITLQQYFQYAAFNGETPLPANTTVIDKMISYSSPQRITDVSRLSPHVKKLIDDVDELSLNSPDLPYREAAAYAFSAQNGEILSQCITSNYWELIHEEDGLSAVFDTGILDAIDGGHIPTHFIDIHTHPSIEYRPDDERDVDVLMSDDDFLSYEFISNLLSYYAGVDIPVYAIVRPVGDSCGDVVIQTHIKPTYHDKEARLYAEEVKAQRVAHNKTLDIVM